MFLVRLRVWFMTHARRARVAFYRKFYGMDIAPSAKLGAQVKLDKSHPEGIHIGAYSSICFGALILSHDHTRGYLRADTRIGSRTLIGSRSIILPGVHIGDEVIVGAGSVVSKDVASNTIVLGNPAKVVKTGINVSALTRLVDYSSLNLIVANNYLYPRGGSERVLFDEVRTLSDRGHKITLFGGTNGNADSLPHSDLLHPVCDYSKLQGLARFSAARGLIYNTDVRRRFTALYQRTHPDLVHCHNIYGGLTTSVLDVCRAKRVPVVITLHDYKLACPSYTMLRAGKLCSRCSGGRFYRCVLGRCHKGSLAASAVYTAESYFNHVLGKYLQAKFLIAPSRFLAGRMIEHGIPAEKLRVIPNGVDLSRFAPSEDSAGYFLYLGRLSREKGLRTLLEAASRVSTPLRILGDGPIRPDLERYARDHNLNRVSFEGHKSGAELEAALRGAAFVVVPSEWYENAPMSVLEAMAYGKPVIASRIGGTPEQVEDGVTGVLLEPDNPDALATVIRLLESDPDRRMMMGRAARARVEQQFSLDLHCSRIAGLYKEAIRG